VQVVGRFCRPGLEPRHGKAGAGEKACGRFPGQRPSLVHAEAYLFASAGREVNDRVDQAIASYEDADKAIRDAAAVRAGRSEDARDAMSR
jgi:hypothetical protein